MEERMKRSVYWVFLLLPVATGVATLLPLPPVFSMPMHPDLEERLKNEGRFEDVVKNLEEARAKGIWEPNPNPVQYDFRTTRPVDQPAIVIIADFQDNVGTRPQSEYEEMLFSLGTYPTESMTEYFLENSYGNLNITGTVTVWLRMPQTYAYYVNGQYGFGSCPRCARRLSYDAVMAADPFIDYSQFDGDNDGYVDALFVVHAGPGAEVTGNPNDIWSHASRTSPGPILVDGVYAWNYAMEPEDGAIGVFGHEMGHSVFGLPDLYDGDYSSRGLGMWSMMAGGSWGGGGTRPVHFDAWCKSAMGFVSPVVVTDHIVDAPLPAVEWTPTLYRLWTGGAMGQQYFMVENRQQMGFDGAIPGEGILVFHVDETMPNNQTDDHYKVDLEQADGERDLNNNQNSGDAGDPFPGITNNPLFDRITNPNSRDYLNNNTQVAVWNMTPSDSFMTANLDVLYWIPRIVVLSTEVQDSLGNNDGRADPGESVNFIATLTNYWKPASSVLGTLTTSDPYITITDPDGSFGNLSTDGVANNISDPFAFSVNSGVSAHFADFFLEITSDGGSYSTTDTITIMIGRPDILFVDDDGGSALESYYTTPLKNLGLLYDFWDRQTQGATTGELSQYPIVIWFTGDATSGTLVPQDETDLSNFLDGGGKLFISSQNLGEDIGSRPFYVNYLKSTFLLGNANNNLLSGVVGDEVSDGLNLVIQGSGGAGNANSEDKISPLSGADSIFSYTNAYGTSALKYDSGVYRVVYFAFPFEAINGVGSFASRDTVMYRVLYWLDPTTVGVEEESNYQLPITNYQLFQNSPNPFHSTTTIRYQISSTPFIKGGKGDLPPLSSPPYQGRDREGVYVRLAVYDLTGRLVKILVDELQEPGVYQLPITSHQFPGSGIYFYHLQIPQPPLLKGEQKGDFTQTRKMILLR